MITGNSTMTERKFTSKLNSKGMAAVLRDSVSQVVRESSILSKPIIVEPIDFEEFVCKNKTLIQNDPHRELLLFPSDDVSEIILPKKIRTVSNEIPKKALKKQNGIQNVENENGSNSGKEKGPGNLLTRQALHTYERASHVIHYKYQPYGGTCHDLPKISNEELKEEIYEVDADPDRIDEQMTKSQANSITKQGFLLKGPDTSSDRMFAHIGSKSFKRRYCYLRHEVDGTYILELHKDDKQGEAKSTIVMDFCTEVIQNSKKGKFCFELKMTEGHKSFTFAAENDKEFEDWVKKLSSILQQNKVQEDKRAASLERAPAPASPSLSSAVFGTLKGLDQSMNPQLMKYGRETDISIAQARRENRKRLFGSFQSLSLKTNSPESNVEPYCEHFGQRLFIKCENIRFRFQAPIDDTDTLCQVEPYITSLALYDTKIGKKLTENFHFDLNKDHIRDMIRCSDNGCVEIHCTSPTKKTPPSNGNGFSKDEAENGSELQYKNSFDFPKEWIMYPRQAIMSVTAPHADIFVVIKIDKILQGNINQSTEPYLKTAKDPRLGSKTNKIIRQYAQKVGHYRMPFAFAARPLFKLYSSDLDTESDFPAIYRQDVNKLKDDDLLKLLSEFRKPDKFNKQLTVIPGWLKITVEPIMELPNNCLTTTLAPLKPFPLPPVEEPTLEIVEFIENSERDVYPFTTFVNHLFIYPTSLCFENQKIFSRARNIAVLVELRDSDLEDAKPIECIYGRPGENILVSQISCPVLHHCANPTWYEEIKLRLPLNITTSHHLLFSFLHVSCDIKKKEKLTTTNTPIGYAWMPLLSKGKMIIDEQTLPVAATLPAGYLSIQPLGLGKGNAGPDITWIDNQRPIFTVSFRLDSTVLTTDLHLHNLFTHAERLLEYTRGPIPSESETCKILKAAHAIHIRAAINFLPTLLDQLFQLLVSNTNEEIGLNIIRLLINMIHMISEEAGRKDLLVSYVKYVFRAPSSKHKPNSSPNGHNTVHGELCRYLPTLLHPNNTDFLVVNKFMKFSNIIFDIIVKSMANYLLQTGRIKMHRNERFSKDFCIRIESLFQVLVPYLISRHKDLPIETQQLNKSLSVFIKRCLTLMDRGFVFKLIRLYMDRWSPGDPRTLQEFKFNFLQEICTHEHYIQLNLPILVSPDINKAPDVLQQFCLSEEFCRQHFLLGLLLQEVRSALNEVGHIRKMALAVMKEVVAKHDVDDRYQTKGQMTRIALLYVPWLGIVLENINRISDGLEHKKTDSNVQKRLSAGSSFVFMREKTPKLSSIPSIAATPTSSTTQSSLSTPKTKRLTLNLEHFSPLRASMYLKDVNYFAAIAGQGNLKNGNSTSSLNSDCSTLSQDTTVVLRNNQESIVQQQFTHNRSISVTQAQAIPRTDKFSVSETKDMLICFLFTIKHMSQENLIIWWHNCTESETASFFTILDLCLVHFRYVGKKNVQLQESLSQKSIKSSTLPARIINGNDADTSSNYESGTLNHSQTRENLVEETVKLQKALQESNLATEIGMVILDCIGLYSIQFRESMADSTVLPKIARVYLRFLQLGQSESLSKHVFAALRAFINNFSQTLFKGTANLCGQLTYELLKCCDSRLSVVRQESCAVLYLLMRSNFEFSGRKGLTRVHLQVIISVSQMIGNVIGLNNARFQESLSLINSYASSDKAMKGTGFPNEVKDLTKRVRTVLMATAQMQSHHSNPEKLIELQYSLANSYASTPELRHTWLVTMARNHEMNGNISEAAFCHLHIAALIAEYLKLKGSSSVNWGAERFGKISKNIPRDEKGLKLDSGTQDSQYTEQLLLDQLRDCAEYIDRAERLECLAELYRLIVPMLEEKRDYAGLITCYDHLSQSYGRVIEFSKTGKRFLGRFYRVVFYGQAYFEEENAVEYVYKEPKVTSLIEISERLSKQYKDKFGAEVVKMIMDSCPIDQSELDPKFAYIQVTHLTPYFCKDELEARQTDFEQNHDVDSFSFETPFTKNGSARGNIEEQYKRRTILTTQYSFPYVLKRIQVKSRQVIELTPIEVAIDEMQSKVSELGEICVAHTIDLKKLQLRLQGSVAVQVNAGPLAYASAFLDPKTCDKFDSEKVEELKDTFREFLKICNIALQVNGRLITSDQVEYHQSLKSNFHNLCTTLRDLLGEQLISLDDQHNAHRNSLALFSAISGTANASSNA